MDMVLEVVNVCCFQLMVVVRVIGRDNIDTERLMLHLVAEAL
jgi:hypothetical protein